VCGLPLQIRSEGHFLCGLPRRSTSSKDTNVVTTPFWTFEKTPFKIMHLQLPLVGLAKLLRPPVPGWRAARRPLPQASGLAVEQKGRLTTAGGSQCWSSCAFTRIQGVCPALRLPWAYADHAVMHHCVQAQLGGRLLLRELLPVALLVYMCMVIESPQQYTPNWTYGVSTMAFPQRAFPRL
jgi:hypothetical protein